MKTQRPVTVGVIGCGEVAQEHLKAWRRVDAARVMAVCDTSERRARETAAAWHIAGSYVDMGDMLASESLSVVDVCAPPQVHCPLVVEALEGGCHVIVEKPFAMSTLEAETMVTQSQRCERKLSAVHNWLYVPVMVRAMSAMRNGLLGDIVGMNVNVLLPSDDRMFADKDHWCHSIPGGVFGEMLAHPIYIVQGIAGKAALVCVHGAKQGGCAWAALDELRVVLDTGAGPASICASFNSCRHDVLVDVYGTEGMFRLDLLSDTLVHLRHRPLKVLSKGIDSLRQACQLGSSISRGAFLKGSRRWVGGIEMCQWGLVQSILDNGQPLVTPDDARDTVTLLEQVCAEIDARRWGPALP